MQSIPKKAFTLIELLVVVAIIGILATVVVVNLSNSQIKSRNATRVANLNAIQKALSLYQMEFNAYPKNPPSDQSVTYSSTCAEWGSHALSAMIPGLAPTFISTLPLDPQYDQGASLYCYVYRSNTKDYALILHYGHVGQTEVDWVAQTSFLDTARDCGSSDPHCFAIPLPADNPMDKLPPSYTNADFHSWKIFSAGGIAW